MSVISRIIIGIGAYKIFDRFFFPLCCYIGSCCYYYVVLHHLLYCLSYQGRCMPGSMERRIGLLLSIVKVCLPPSPHSMAVIIPLTLCVVSNSWKRSLGNRSLLVPPHPHGHPELSLDSPNSSRAYAPSRRPNPFRARRARDSWKCSFYDFFRSPAKPTALLPRPKCQ